MRTFIVLCAAALCAGAISAPASAQSWSDSRSGSTFHDGRDRHGGDNHRDGRHHRRDRNAAFFAGPWASDTWALYNNQSWESDSFNDWWHDRPDRAYPRWVQQNQNCTEDRMWWSGSGWHC